MADEKSKLVETVEQETQETKTKEISNTNNAVSDEFNPLAFTSEVPLEKVNNNETQQNEKEINNNSEETFEEDDWDAVTDKTRVSENEESTSRQDSELDWGKIGKELGINANSKEDIATALNSKNPGVNTESIIQFQKFLSMDDRQLLSEEMKADGMKHDDVEDVLDKMEDSGMMKREAHRVRKQLQQAIDYEKSSSSEMTQKEQQERLANANNAKKELQTHLKKMDRFMGGKITKDQARKAYSYITSGKMSEDIWKSHDNASEVAMFMLFKDKFMKILRAQGLEDGKASVFNKITSPNLSRNSKPTYKVKKDGFDPEAFMKE